MGDLWNIVWGMLVQVTLGLGMHKSILNCDWPLEIAIPAERLNSLLRITIPLVSFHLGLCLLRSTLYTLIVFQLLTLFQNRENWQGWGEWKEGYGRSLWPVQPRCSEIRMNCISDSWMSLVTQCLREQKPLIWTETFNDCWMCQELYTRSD